MKQIIVLFALLVVTTNRVIGQNSIIDQKACDNWCILKDFSGKCSLISNDGKYVAYSYDSTEYFNITVIVDVLTDKKIRLHNILSPKFTNDSKHFIGKNINDSLIIVSLKIGMIEYVANVKSFSIPETSNGQLISFDRRDNANTTIVKNLVLNTSKVFAGTTGSWFNSEGTRVVIREKKGLKLINAKDWKSISIPNSENAISVKFNPMKDGIAFIKNQDTPILYYFKESTNRTEILVNQYSTGISKGYRLSNGPLTFSSDGIKLFFKVKTKNSDNNVVDSRLITSQVNIWSYKDIVLNPSKKQQDQRNLDREYLSVVHLESKNISQLETKHFSIENGQITSHFALLTNNIVDAEFYFNKQVKSLILVSLDNYSRLELFAEEYPSFYNALISPSEEFIVWFNGADKNYYSYDILKKRTRNISEVVRDEMSVFKQRGQAAKTINTEKPFRSMIWVDTYKYVVYSSNDIWLLDPRNKVKPRCITNKVGKKQNITFRLLTSNNKPLYMKKNVSLLAWAFDNKEKRNGFFEIFVHQELNPIKLLMDNNAYYFNPTSQANTGLICNPDNLMPVKSKNEGVFIIRKMNACESPNLLLTRDFKEFKKLTDFKQEKNFVWTKPVLVEWKLPDGKACAGTLHRPSNFDSTKRYPIIFTYYERHSDLINVFRYPELAMGPINIPWYVSRDYLVFEPDFYYERGKTAESVLSTIDSSIALLKKLKYVDTLHMGIQGHSHGGYETNIIATSRNYFAAACEAAGYTNIISEYGSIRPDGYNNQRASDMDQRNLGVFPWEAPEVFIKNSPVFHISNMTTPLLMVHNKNDDGVLFSQAIELYLAMRRLGKKVWLLDYDNETHQLSDKKNKLDYTIRMQQFFDHFLKEVLPPVWMTKGIPPSRKSVYSGLELDSTQ